MVELGSLHLNLHQMKDAIVSSMMGVGHFVNRPFLREGGQSLDV